MTRPSPACRRISSTRSSTRRRSRARRRSARHGALRRGSRSIAQRAANWRAALADTYPGRVRAWWATRSSARPRAATRSRTLRQRRPARVRRAVRGFPRRAIPTRATFRTCATWRASSGPWHECFHAAGAAPIDLAALARVARRTRTATSASRCIRPRAWSTRAFPILAIWEANQPGRDGTPERLEGTDTRDRASPGARRAGRRSLERADWRFLARPRARRDALEAAAERRAATRMREELGSRRCARFVSRRA